MATGLLVYAHGAFLFMSLMPAGPVFYACGLSSFISKGPAQFVDLMIGYIDCLAHDMMIDL